MKVWQDKRQIGRERQIVLLRDETQRSDGRSHDRKKGAETLG